MTVTFRHLSDLFHALIASAALLGGVGFGAFLLVALVGDPLSPGGPLAVIVGLGSWLLAGFVALGGYTGLTETFRPAAIHQQDTDRAAR